MRVASIVSALALLLARPALAQEGGPPRGPACADAIPASALTPRVVWLTSTYDDSADVARAGVQSSIDLLTQTVAQRARALLADSSALTPAERHITWRDLGREVSVTQAPDGALAWREADGPADDIRTGHAATMLLLRALDSLGAHGEVFIPRDTLDRDTLTFTLGFHAVAPLVAADSAHLPFRVAFRLLTVPGPSERPVAPKRGTFLLQYPEQRRKDGYQAVVVARYVVDADGRLRQNSFHAIPPRGQAARGFGVGSIYNDFAEAVRRALAGAQFFPARIGDCAVPQLVRQEFTFNLRRR